MTSIKIIAEIGSVHDGSFGNAKCLIRAAADCGADAVKFQTHIAEAESLRSAPSPDYFKDESRWDYFKRTAFSLEQYQQLREFCEKKCGIEFMSSPFSMEAVDLLEEVGISTYKIPSGEVTNIPLLIKLAQVGKPILLSSGMSSWDELDAAVHCLKEHGCKDLIVLQCTSAYPCLPEHAGVQVIKEIKKRYQVPAGFSDHTLGTGISILAAASGAEVIEKHFTLSRKLYGSDAKYATEPQEFSSMVSSIRSVQKALSHTVDKNKSAASLREMKHIFEKSIILNRDLQKGAILKEEHLCYKKPGDGISAREFRGVLGSTLLMDLTADTKLSWDMLQRK